MHFVARSTLDTAYNAQPYTLRQDPLVIFRQPPTHINQRSMSIAGVGMTSPHHRRSTSAGSFKQMHLLRNNEENVTSSDPLLTPTTEKTHETQENTPNHVDHDCKASGCQRVVLNIAGQKYETQLKTISRLPSTLLGDPEKRKKYWDKKRKEYFFDRHRPSFPAILYYYQSGGRLKRPVEVPLDIFLEELEFYELGQTVINAFKASEGLRDPADDMFDEEEEGDGSVDGKEGGRGLQGAIWRTFEQPGSTVLSTIVAVMSVVFILASICTYCIETLPRFKNSDCLNLTETDENGTVTGSRMYPNFGHPLFLIESCCITWFVFELILRAATCPSIIRFVRDFSNIIDCVSILPYFLFLIMFFVNNSCDNNSKFFSVLRVFRVARIFKLGRFSEGLQILGKTLQVSISELFMFVLFLGIGVVIFAAAIFFVESQNENSFFVSIPDSFWWAVISMTTVGYGDVYPISLMGKMIGSMCVLSGLLAIALPVPVIVTNFNNIYRQATGRGNNL